MLTQVKKYIRETLEIVDKRIKANIDSHGRTASGRTAKSMVIEDTEWGGKLVGSGSFLAMERGRKGGRVPYGFRDIILEWIKDKGIQVAVTPAKRASKYSDLERAQRSAAGAIAYTIMTKGTRLHRTGGFDDILTTVIAEEMTKLRPKIIGSISLMVRDINDNMAKYANKGNN